MITRSVVHPEAGASIFTRPGVDWIYQRLDDFFTPGSEKPGLQTSTKASLTDGFGDKVIFTGHDLTYVDGALTSGEITRMEFKTPEGKTFRFVHEDAYDEIDGTYETITAYLDAKDIVSKDVFVEEYVTDLTESSDANLKVNIYVQPKD